MLYTEAKSVIQDKSMAKKAADTFMDVVADSIASVAKKHRCRIYIAASTKAD